MVSSSITRQETTVTEVRDLGSFLYFDFAVSRGSDGALVSQVRCILVAL